MYNGLGRSAVLSRMDLKTPFHHIRLSQKDTSKKDFNTKYGQYDYMMMRMGLCNAQATFVTLLHSVRNGLIEHICAFFMGDILIHSKKKDKHYMHLELILRRLNQKRLYFSPIKCSFDLQEVDLWGVIVTKTGTCVNPENAKLVLETWPNPN